MAFGDCEGQVQCILWRRGLALPYPPHVRPPSVAKQTSGEHGALADQPCGFASLQAKSPCPSTAKTLYSIVMSSDLTIRY